VAGRIDNVRVPTWSSASPSGSTAAKVAGQSSLSPLRIPCALELFSELRRLAAERGAATETAGTHLREALDLAERIGFLEVAVAALRALASISSRSGNPPEASRRRASKDLAPMFELAELMSLNRAIHRWVKGVGEHLRPGLRRSGRRNSPRGRSGCDVV